MCVVSVIHDYGKKIPEWNQEMLDQFQKLVEQASKFDQIANEPNCEDPEKLKWVLPIELALQDDAVVVYHEHRPAEDK